MATEVKNLKVTFQTRGGPLYAVRDISFTIPDGKTVALVGESGCGKSVTAHSLVGLNPPCKTEGSILFNNRDLLKLDDKAMRSVRGSNIAMIFQNPMTSLNPTMKIGSQIAEGIRRHRGAARKEALLQAKEMLELVGIDPTRINEYPHQFSGGMRQRVMIAIALACHPELLIADEPTTSLDVDTQTQILSLIQKLQKQLKMSMLFITHNLQLINGLCDEVVVMYAGKIVEKGPVAKIFANPIHPYTQALLAAIPQKDKPLQAIHGQPPNMHQLPKGCSFCPRCPHKKQICETKEPPAFCWQEVENE